MLYYKPVQIIITPPVLAEVILNVVVGHHGLLDSIVSNRGSVFTFRFWSSFCYFLSIKWRLSIAFYPQTDSQTKWQNNMMEAYLRPFVNCKQNNWARFLPMAEFVYNNAKYTSMGYMPFELNYEYHLCVFYKEDVDPCSRSKAADELTKELRNLIAVCKENLQHAQKLQK